MSKSRNEQLSTLRPLATRRLEGVAHRGDEERQTRRSAENARIYRNRRLALGAIGVAMVAAGAAGSGRLLVHDIERGAHDAVSNRVEAVSSAFSDPNPGVVTGEPSSAAAEHQIHQRETRNETLAAAKAAEANAQSK